MATLQSLKETLLQQAGFPPESREPLSDWQYANGFKAFVDGLGWRSYAQFVIPQLEELLQTLIRKQGSISVLEIGPGPRSVLGHLSSRIRQNVAKYAAMECNSDFCSSLQDCLPTDLPNLDTSPDIRHSAFNLDDDGIDGTFDAILFCHSLYGLKPANKYIQKAITMLAKAHTNGIIIVFHRANTLQLDGLVYQTTASFPMGTVVVDDADDEVLDRFAEFVAGTRFG